MDDHCNKNKAGDEIRLSAEDREFSPFQEIIEDNLDIPADELSSHRRAFKAGLGRAELKQDFSRRGSRDRGSKLLVVTPRQWLGFAAAAVVLVATLATAFWYANRVLQPRLLADAGEVYAVSGMFGDLRSNLPGFNRFRTSNRGIAVPGVSVEYRDSFATQSASIFGQTAWAQQPQAVPRTGELVFKLNGVETRKIDLNQIQPDGQLVPVEIDTTGQLFKTGTKVEYQIDLAPGETHLLNDTMQVTLDRSAPGPWQGELIHDLNWPDIFRYGNVVDGIFYFDGPATDHLRFTKAMSAGYLSHLTDEPRRVKVIAERFDAGPINSIEETTWHSIPSGNTSPNGVAEPIRANPIRGGFAVTWPVDIEERYALLSPPGNDGDLEVLHIYDQGTTGQPGRRHVIPNGFKRPQNGRWKSRYSAPGIPQTRLTVQSQSPGVDVDLDTPNELPGRDAIEIFTAQRDTDPGEFTALRYDFTYSEFTEYGPIQLACPVHEGQYELVADPASGLVRLAGDLEFIEGSLEWDLDADQVIDGTGSSYRVEVNPLQLREIAVYFSEQNGSRLRLKTSLTTPTAGAIWHDQCPAIFAVANPPQTETHVMTVVPGSMQKPYPAGVLASRRLIPYIIIQPSPEFLRRPLDRLTFTVNGSAGWGSVDHIHFDPFVFPAVITGAVGAEKISYIDGYFGDRPTREFSFANAGIDARDYLDMFYEGYGQDVMRRLEWLISKASPDDKRRDTYEQAYKFDIADLPSESEVLQKLEDFVTDDFYTLEYLTEYNQQMQFTINLLEHELQPGQVIVIGLTTENRGGPFMGQWDVYSGGDDPARVEIKAVGSDEKDVHYFDFSPFKP